MNFAVTTLMFVFFHTGFKTPVLFQNNVRKECRFAFNFTTDENDSRVTVNICKDPDNVPVCYESAVNMPVCDDTLCADVSLRIFWDLAGNYLNFDTIPGFQLTKFDHKKFTANDYLKLDEILKNRNSILRMLHKDELVDKSVKIKATTVDAVTGATPQTIKNAVVEGAVYTSYTLWHLVNGPVKDGMVLFTESIYSEQVSLQMLNSVNYETQLFALKKWTETDYELHAGLIFRLIKQSVPLVRAYIISNVPLPLNTAENNKMLIDLWPFFDGYSKSIFLGRITSDSNSGKILLPLLLNSNNDFSEKQQVQIKNACNKFGINWNEPEK